jgi:hypothetical protein
MHIECIFVDVKAIEKSKSVFNPYRRELSDLMKKHISNYPKP